jgi:hypothetical protein
VERKAEVDTEHCHVVRDLDEDTVAAVVQIDEISHRDGEIPGGASRDTRDWQRETDRASRTIVLLDDRAGIVARQQTRFGSAVKAVTVLGGLLFVCVPIPNTR